MSKNSNNDFLLHDFDQIYEQYRHLDDLRIHYIKYFVTLVVAVFTVSFSISAIYQVNLSIEPYLTLFTFLYIVLFVLGGFVFWISMVIRERQLTHTPYLSEIRKYYCGKDNLRLVYFAELAIDEKWFSLKQSAIILIILLNFLNSSTLFFPFMLRFGTLVGFLSLGIAFVGLMITFWLYLNHYQEITYQRKEELNRLIKENKSCEEIEKHIWEKWRKSKLNR